MVNLLSFTGGKILRTAFFLFLSLNAIAFDTIYNCGPFYNSEDATSVLRDAINSGAGKIIIPYMGAGSKWLSGPLLLDSLSDTEIVLEPGVILEAKHKAFPDKYTSFITLHGCSNIKITGPGAEIRMRKRDYTDESEWRHGISILSSQHITVQGIIISETGGDGIYIGNNSSVPNFSSNIIIRDFISEDNARNGISVISCKNLLIENCEIKRTGYGNLPDNAAMGPWAGIDLEPNFSDEILDSIVIKNCILSGNRGFGILFSFGGAVNNIEVTNNLIHDNWAGITLIGNVRGQQGDMLIKDNSVYGRQNYGLLILNWNKTGISVNFEDSRINNAEIAVPIKFDIDDKTGYNLYGNIVFRNTQFTNVKNTCLVHLSGADANKKYENISFFGTTWLSSSEYEKYQQDKINIDSYFSVDSVAGENIFCLTEKTSTPVYIYPNPFSDGFYIMSNSINLFEVQVVDINGRQVGRQFARDGEFISCGSLASGNYIIIAKDIATQQITEMTSIRY